MLLDSRFLKVLRPIGYPWGQHFMLCMFFLGAGLSEAAWGLSKSSDSEHHSLQTSIENFSDYTEPLNSGLAAPLIRSISSPVADPAHRIEVQKNSLSNYPVTTDGDGKPNVLYLAAPENLNPGLYIPPPVAPPSELVEPETVEPEHTKSKSDEIPSVPIWEIDDLTVDLSDDFSNFDQGKQIIEPTVTGTLRNGDRLSITTGFNRYTQPDVNTVFNIPLKADWEQDMGDFTTTVGGGVDLFNQLPIAINLNASTSVPIGKKATLSFFVDYGPYKFNATTLNNQIKALRYGPNLYWQITPDMYFFSLVRWGHYNDGNREQQSFSRLEKGLGDFYIAGNLFTWQYREDAESDSGYFSPPDFLVANAEVGWKGEVLDWLDCGASAAWGRQRLNSSWSSAYNYNAECTFQITDALEIDLGYAFSNVVAQTGGSAFNNRAITSQVRAKF